MGSEVTTIDKVEKPSYNVPKNKSEKSIIWEPAELYMTQERNYERDSLILACNPMIDNNPQVLVNNVDKMYLDEYSNCQANEKGYFQRKQNDKNCQVTIRNENRIQGWEIEIKTSANNEKN